MDAVCRTMAVAMRSLSRGDSALRSRPAGSYDDVRESLESH